jgi:hypothetical protein
MKYHEPKYYEVLVEIKLQTEDSKGNVKIKRLKETYLVDAMSVTEAEARIVKLFEGYSQEYSVLQVKSSKVLEVIEAKSESKKEETKETKATEKLEENE